MTVLLKDKLVVLLLKFLRMDKIFLDLIFAKFTMLEAWFNFPRWMNLFGFYLKQSRSISLSTSSNSIWGEVKTTFSSGSSKLGLWATVGHAGV